MLKYLTNKGNVNTLIISYVDRDEAKEIITKLNKHYGVLIKCSDDLIRYGSSSTAVRFYTPIGTGVKMIDFLSEKFGGAMFQLLYSEKEDYRDGGTLYTVMGSRVMANEYFEPQRVEPFIEIWIEETYNDVVYDGMEPC